MMRTPDDKYVTKNDQNLRFLFKRNGWVFLNSFSLHRNNFTTINRNITPTGGLQAIEIGTPPNFIGVEAEKFVEETFHLKLPI